MVPYDTSDLETCPNVTQVVKMDLNDLRKMQVARILFRYTSYTCATGDGFDVTEEMNRIGGFEPSQIDYDCTLLECHVDLDLEGFEDVGQRVASQRA